MARTRMIESSEFGCSVKLLVVAVVCLIIGLGSMKVINLLSGTGLPEVETTAVAAKRAREKFSQFNKLPHVREVTLSKLEINSAIKEEAAQANGFFRRPWMDFEGEVFVFGGEWSLFSLLISEDRLEASKPGSFMRGLLNYRTTVTIRGFLTVEDGFLRIDPQQIVVGHIDLPPRGIEWVKERRARWFKLIPVPHISEARLLEDALLFVK